MRNSLSGSASHLITNNILLIAKTFFFCWKLKIQPFWGHFDKRGGRRGTEGAEDKRRSLLQTKGKRGGAGTNQGESDQSEENWGGGEKEEEKEGSQN